MTMGYRILIMCLMAASLSACKGGDDRGLPEGLSDLTKPLANTYAYHPDAPIAATALRCATVETSNDSCTLAELAPIAFNNPNPTVDDVMERVLVSHAWMGERFEELLLRMPDDILYLFGGVTAIVIDDDIRPSYYTTLTGAIYLDPYGLWLTETEYADINLAPDYRGAYAEVMAFRSFWRYLIPGVDGERTLANLEPDLASLLFHELAHANDLFPRNHYPTADVNQRFAAVIDAIAQEPLVDDDANFLSTQLIDMYPLLSEQMQTLANILFLGYTASASDRMITAAQVGEYFSADGANDDYAYASQYEDLAMLFEESMMKLHYAAERDVVFANLPEPGDSEIVCDDFKVAWGVRNRLGDEQVKPRAIWVVEHLLPHRDYSMLFDTLAEPAVIPAGLGWCESENFELVSTSPLANELSSTKALAPIELNSMLRRSELRFH